MFLKPKHFIFECRPNFGSFYPLLGLLRAITFSAPKPPPLQISAYATEERGLPNYDEIGCRQCNSRLVGAFLIVYNCRYKNPERVEFGY